MYVYDIYLHHDHTYFYRYVPCTSDDMYKYQIIPGTEYQQYAGVGCCTGEQAEKKH